MEVITQNIPLAVSVVLAAVLVLMVITNIITEVLKKALYGVCPVNILVLCVAMIVTLAATLAACQMLTVPITWYLVAGAVVLGLFVAYAAMFGFDKFKQTIGQITDIGKKV